MFQLSQPGLYLSRRRLAVELVAKQWPSAQAAEQGRNDDIALAMQRDRGFAQGSIDLTVLAETIVEARGQRLSGR